MNKNKDSSFLQQVERHYAITLLDVLYGSSIASLIADLEMFEDREAYEVCEGIKRAINFCRTKTILDIKKELVSLLEEKRSNT